MPPLSLEVFGISRNRIARGCYGPVTVAFDFVDIAPRDAFYLGAFSTVCRYCQMAWNWSAATPPS